MLEGVLLCASERKWEGSRLEKVEAVHCFRERGFEARKKGGGKGAGVDEETPRCAAGKALLWSI